MNRTLSGWTVGRVLVVGLVALGLFGVCLDLSMAEDVSWKEDFDRLCSFTDVANTLEPPKLTELIHDCDALLERLQKVSDPKKKLYIFRTKKCRDLFEFVLQTKGG